VHGRRPEVVESLAAQGAQVTPSLAAQVQALQPPRVLWLMVPAAAVDEVLGHLRPLLAEGDVIVDGGNSFYGDDIRRARDLAAHGIHHVDVGTSGGVHGLARGYCLMVGGESAIVVRLRPLFEALAPGADAAAPNPGRAAGRSSADQGWLHCGPHGAGHFVKMVHNGIEYGLMAAYAEGLNILRRANVGSAAATVDAETAPLADPALYRYDFDVAEIAELWRRGSVIGSWLLDLTAQALAADPRLEGFEGRVSDSGEGRWTVRAAVDEGVPAPVLSAALFARFGSRGHDDYAHRVLSAMRHAFGGHAETKPEAGRHD
jgi:6-phosphogluconate dehydrogenase